MATLADVAFILKRLESAYGNEVSADMARSYHQVLRDFPRLVLVRVAHELMRDIKFFPRIAEFVRLAKIYKHDYFQGDSDWEKCDEAAQWLMYQKGYVSTDEITEADLKAIYADAGVPMVTA